MSNDPKCRSCTRLRWKHLPPSEGGSTSIMMCYVGRRPFRDPRIPCATARLATGFCGPKASKWKPKPAAMQEALQALVDTINALGGVFEDDHGRVCPVSVFGGAYLKACETLGLEPLKGKDPR